MKKDRAGFYNYIIIDEFHHVAAAFHFGFTLSINKDKGWEEAFDYICEKLEGLKEKGGTFAPVSIVRCVEPNRTQYVKTEHIVPETGMNMLVYHLVLQISDSERHKIAIEARK